jgi:hypothetical protein
MVFGALYYQGFVKKDKHGGKDNGAADKDEVHKDAEKGESADIAAPLLTKQDDRS